MMCSVNPSAQRLVVLAFVALASTALVLAVQVPGGQGGPAPKGMYQVGGARDGVSAFPMVDYPQLKPVRPGVVDFQHYHTYQETVSLLEMWAPTPRNRAS